MGLFDKWTEQKRVKQAAKEFWQAIRGGRNFEVPLKFDRNDLTLQAIVKLQNDHPEVELRMYQSKGIVLGLFRSASENVTSITVGQQAWNMLKQAGTVNTGKVTIDSLIAGHEAWIRQQGWDPAKQERAAQHEEAEKRAITVSDSTAEALKKQSAEVLRGEEVLKDDGKSAITNPTE